MSHKRVLVTGASGFLANCIIPNLIEGGYYVVGIDNRLPDKSIIPMFEVDITDANSFNKIPNDMLEVDCILHLAAIAAPNQCRDNPKLAYDVNVLGTNNVLKWAVGHHVKKFVFLSSAHVYGISPKFMPTPEHAPLQLTDTYTTSKILGETLCYLYYNDFNLPYLTFRLFNSYGPHQNLDYFIPKKIDEAKRGKIDLIGAKTTKDWVYLDDTVDAIIKGINSDYVGELNLGTGRQISLETIARLIAERYHAGFSIAEKQPPATYMQADTSRLKNVLGWEPLTSFEEGIEKTLKWYDGNA